MDVYQYQRLTQLQQMLLRPDTVIGSVEPEQKVQLTMRNSKFFQQYVILAPALMRLYIEILSNAFDNVIRSRKAGIDPGLINIQVTYDTITIYNQGQHIQTINHPTYGIPLPQLIFTELNSSSNYNDNEQRETSGRNGLGAKAANIFAVWFQYICSDPTNRQVYKQLCENNNTVIHPPEITPYDPSAGPYTQISYKADFARFGCHGYDEAMIDYFRAYAFEGSYAVGVPVYFNGEDITCRTINQYATAYIENLSELKTASHKDDNTELLLVDMPFNGFFVAFTNGIKNFKGGVHVDTCYHAIGDPIIDKINKKEKRVDIGDVKKHITMFLNCRLPNPVFNGQTKEYLSKPKPVINLPKTFLGKLNKWGIMEGINSTLVAKSQVKTTARKSRIIDIPKAFGCEWRNDVKHLHETALVLTEGDSAKAFAVSFISHIPQGSKKYAGLPLKGKSMNVRTHNAIEVNDNIEFSSIIKMMNFREGVDYTQEVNLRTLSLGMIVLMRDADEDGLHICGLILNFLQQKFPSFLKTRRFMELITPVIKATKGKEVKRFYTLKEAHDFEATAGSGWKFKYYKGLGTSTKDDVKFIAANPIIRVFIYDDAADECLKNAFDKKLADQRKQWINDFCPNPENINIQYTNISDFVKQELITYWIRSIIRSIPAKDGLKESIRKIVYTLLTKTFKDSEVKVAQLGAAVAEWTHYHHGEKSLFSAIVGMAANFIGKGNNLPLLMDEGQFGSRLGGGNDSAETRYIFTKPNPYFHMIFNKKSTPILEGQKEEGNDIEPKRYFPRLPLFMLNSSNGIATGWSSTTPSYSVNETCHMIRLWINSKMTGQVQEYPPLYPYYKGYKGYIQVKPKSVLFYGIFTATPYQAAKDSQVVHYNVDIYELPIGCWTNDYEEMLKEWVTQKLIDDYTLERSLDFVRISLKGVTFEPTYKSLKLTKTMTSNIVLLDDNNKPHHFESIKQAFFDYCDRTYNHYIVLKDYEVKFLYNKIAQVQDKKAYIEAVRNKQIDIFWETDKILSKMRELGIKNEKLVNISSRQFNKNEITKLESEISKLTNEYTTLYQTFPGQLWLNDINEIEAEYIKQHGYDERPPNQILA